MPKSIHIWLVLVMLILSSCHSSAVADPTPLTQEQASWLQDLVNRAFKCSIEVVYVIPGTSPVLQQGRYTVNNRAARCMYRRVSSRGDTRIVYPDGMLERGKASEWNDFFEKLAIPESYSDDIVYEFWPNVPRNLRCTGMASKVDVEC